MNDQETLVLLKDLKPNMKRICTQFMVLEIGDPTRVKENEVRTVKVADASGSINCSVWNEKGNLIKPGDILRLTNGNTTTRAGCLTLNVGRYGELLLVDAITMIIKDTPDFSVFNENYSVKPKVSRTKKPPPPPKGLPEVIDRLTTGGSKALDQDLLSDLLVRICESADEKSYALRLLFQQVQRPHAQIRLGVVRVLDYLTKDPLKPGLNAFFRESILLKLQDLLPHCVPISSADKPLPPPEKAAEELKHEILSLLLRWESDESCRSLSRPAQGQLSSAMRYLRSPLNHGSGSARLKEAARILKALEEDAAQRARSSQIADAVIRRRLLAAKNKYLESRATIEENLKSLEGVVHLLVPDPFETETQALVASQGHDDVDKGDDDDIREHGYLPGGEISVSFSLEFADQGLHMPEIQLILTEETRLLRETGKGFVNVALEHHRQVLDDYYELSKMFATNPELRALCSEDQEAVLALRSKLNRSVQQFSAIRFIEASAEEPLIDDVDDDDDDEDGFVDVASVTDPDELDLTLEGVSSEAKRLREQQDHQEAEEGRMERILSQPMSLLTDKLPWEMEGHPTSSLSKKIHKTPLGSRATVPSQTRHRKRDAPRESVILPSEASEKPRQRVENESLHKFWKPIDAAEYEAPEVEQIEAVIASTPGLGKSPAVPIIDAQQFAEELQKEEGLPPEAYKSETTGASSKPTSSVNTPNKGRRLATLNSKQDQPKRRRYPNLENISKSNLTTEEVLKKRLLNPRKRKSA